MLRIHFTSEDLGRVRVAAAPDPMWEVLLSLHMLRSRQGAPVFEQWRTEVRASVAPAVRMLLDLAPPRGYSPDFLTPTPSTGELEAGIGAVLTTPHHRLRAEMELLTGQRRQTGWTQQLAAGDATALRRLGEEIRTYHQQALAPHWTHIRARFEVERLTRARAFLNGGVEQLLGSLHPSTRWCSPTLEVEYPILRDLHLNGRGLLLVPSFFCWQQPVSLLDPNLPPVLIYPLTHHPGWLDATPSRARPLAALLGRTRAAALETVASGCTTGELSRRLAISSASASEHAAVLRDAGLISSHRERNTVHHTPTTLGLELLHGP